MKITENLQFQGNACLATRVENKISRYFHTAELEI